MNRIKFLIFGVFVVLLNIQCNDDDDAPTVVLRDEGEVKLENAQEINQFLEEHYFVLEENSANPNFDRIRFGKLTDQNAPSDAAPIKDSEFLHSRPFMWNDYEYELFYLKIREGASTERQATFADSVLITYEGRTMENQVIDGAANPVWFDLTQFIVGFREGVSELRGSSGFNENPDGSFAFNEDFGVGAVFVPSGLGYFAAPPSNSGIASYAPLIFSYQLYRSRTIDHDNDGIPSYMEDINNTRRLDDVDTNGNRIFNYLDDDDDGDGVPTRDEIIIEEDGTIIFPDSNGNGTPDYLDPTYP